MADIVATGRAESSPSRESLRAAAASLFALKGYRATTLDDIATALGLKKASLYHYIRSKDELLIEIYEKIFDEIEAAVSVPLGLDVPPDERLRRMIHAHIAVVAARRSMLTVAFREESELPDEMRKQIVHRKRAYEALFERVIVEGQRSGVFRSTSPRLTVLGLIGMANSIHTWYREDKFGIEAIAGEFALLIESGILSGDRRTGAWPRYDSVDDALAPATRALRQLRADLEQAESKLDTARERLSEGLAPSNRPPLAVAKLGRKRARGDR